MADVHDKKIRSYNMSRIKNKDTKPELIIRKILYNKGFRYRLNVKEIKGTPDIVIRKFDTVIFINGCFWHGHKGCNKFIIPKTRTKWWLNKINNNVNRDKKTIKQLKKNGWTVLTIWECQLKYFKTEKGTLRLIKKIID